MGVFVYSNNASGMFGRRGSVCGRREGGNEHSPVTTKPALACSTHTHTHTIERERHTLLLTKRTRHDWVESQSADHRLPRPVESPSSVEALRWQKIASLLFTTLQVCGFYTRYDTPLLLLWEQGAVDQPLFNQVSPLHVCVALSTGCF